MDKVQCQQSCKCNWLAVYSEQTCCLRKSRIFFFFLSSFFLFFFFFFFYFSGKHFAAILIGMFKKKIVFKIAAQWKSCGCGIVLDEFENSRKMSMNFWLALTLFNFFF